MKEKTVGIIGGMGPEATIDLMARVLKATPAIDDIDHIRLVVDNNPKVPSRIKALIEKTGENPLACLQEMARKLSAWGVDLIAIPCNTAHFYHSDIQRVVGIPILNMIELTFAAMTTEHPGLKTVGILASTAVLNLGLYKKRFAQSDIQVLEPSKAFQDGIMAAIRKIKTSRYGKEVVSALQAAADDLTANGADALLLACTELSIIGQQIQTAVPCYDSAQILAEAIVKKAKGALAQQAAGT
jgi:aspartate racemase